MLRQSAFRLAWQFGSIKQFKLPDLGEKIKEAVVKQWHVKVGDRVEEFQPVADVATDKMFTQIPSSYNGVVHKIFHEVEQTCQVGDVFLEINTDSQQPSVTESHTNEYVLTSPSVRRMARERSIDLTKVRGSGKDGRIVATDLDNISSPVTKPASEPSKTVSQPVTPVKVSPQVGESKQTGTTVNMSDFQKGMQKSMTESNNIPTLYLMEEYDLTALVWINNHMRFRVRFVRN